MTTYKKYDCAKADSAKQERLHEFCQKLAQAWIAQASAVSGRMRAMFDADIISRDITDIVFEYSEEKGEARVLTLVSEQGKIINSFSAQKEFGYTEAYLYFPLWMLKKAAKEGLQYVSCRQVYLE